MIKLLRSFTPRARLGFLAVALLSYCIIQNVAMKLTDPWFPLVVGLEAFGFFVAILYLILFHHEN